MAVVYLPRVAVRPPHPILSELPPVGRAACFRRRPTISLWIAVASPIDALDDYLLAAHMIQHFILMSVAPPLIVLGAPMVPLLRGLPRWILRGPLRWLFASPGVQRLMHTLSHPAIIWVAMNVAYLGCTLPPPSSLPLPRTTGMTRSISASS